MALATFVVASLSPLPIVGAPDAVALPAARGGQAVTPGRPELKIVVIEGEGAVNIIQQKTAVAPVVEVRDRNDQPVAGAVVTFAIRSGRGTFGGGLRTLSVTTNATGRAAAAGFSPTASGAVQINVAASFQGQTAAATIAQTNVATAAQATSATAGGTGATSGGLSAVAIGGIVGGAAAGAVVAVKVANQLQGLGDCVLEVLSLPNPQNLLPAGGGAFSLTASFQCTGGDARWTISSDQPWIAFPSGASFINTATVALQVAPNTAPQRRTASISIETESSGGGFSITQEAAGVGSFAGQLLALGPVTISTPTCATFVALNNVAISFTADGAGAISAAASATRTEQPSLSCSSGRPGSREDFVLEEGSTSASTITLRFRATTLGSTQATLTFQGALTSDGRRAAGSVTLRHSGVDGERTVTAPITLTRSN